MNHSIEKERIVTLINSSEQTGIMPMTKNETAIGLQFNLQYSLRLIEASTDYLLITNTEKENINIHTSNANEELIAIVYQRNQTGKCNCTKEMIKELLKDHERIINQLQKRIELSDCAQDNETTEFVSFIIEEHQNIAGKFRKYF